MKRTNIHGESFTIDVVSASVPEEADYWGFYYKVEDSRERKHNYRLIIKRTFIQDPEEAKRFARDGMALDAIFSILDDVVNGSSPIVWPNTDACWYVF